MAILTDTRTLLATATFRQLAAVFVASIGTLYVLAKVFREIAHALFPSFIPGEPNTALLASPSPDTGAEASAEQLSNVREYDYIVVGTGTAGCVLANRLTEDPSVSVLAIESGHSDLKQIFSRIPAAFGQLFGTAADWDLWTEKEANCNSRKLAWPRGKMLGGCSAINAMIYNKGSPDDFDEFERLGNPGWGFSSLRNYMTKAETFSPSHTHGLDSEDLAQHGRSGPWKIGYSHFTGISGVFLEACATVGIPIVRDLNTDKGIKGVSRLQTFIDPKGQRSSTAVAYLTEDVVSRSNLKIATGQTVTKIIFDHSGSKPRAIGVEMSSSKISPIKYLARAKREVIVSAGALHTPHILKLSGIGPAAELQQHGIKVIKELAGVGANLADHLLGNFCFGSKAPSLQYLMSPVKSLPALIEWLRHGTGAMTSNVAETAGFLRTADRSDAPASLRENDLSSGPNSVDLEILGGPLAYIDHGRHIAPTSKNWYTVGPIMLRPSSRGTVTLASADPFAPPRIDANYLATQHDRDMMLYGMKLSRDIARSKPFEPIFDGWYFPGGDVDTMTDEQIMDHVRQHCETIYHPMGTAKMGPAADETAVVDARLKVHGIEGLRVVDASVS
ncbi:hypothetical protein FH972_021340 [Carpinus fangiana]|uniref:Glucose-methanol-choline oxidoreductase N-terminal domain-containing protein n=1 Tax=Carpinus fangiana TaxID=176857 RepID=A0A5N6KPG4_9ROSI|nr:hypothetical protein FH972_021340 [Carpinus fangiana]